MVYLSVVKSNNAGQGDISSRWVCRGRDVHLLSSVDEALLCWRNALLLFDALLYP
jgi:hypothetical protein